MGNYIVSTIQEAPEGYPDFASGKRALRAIALLTKLPNFGFHKLTMLCLENENLTVSQPTTRLRSIRE